MTLMFPGARYKTKKMTYGIGINDADYVVVNDNYRCTYYNTWKSMLERCYSRKWIDRQPAYTQCTVDPEWLFFSVFREWMVKQDWRDKHLDKDVLIPGNKHYSAVTCCFVPRSINNMCKSGKGVTKKKNTGRYIAQLGGMKGKSQHLGSFNTFDEARKCYATAKSAWFRDVASQQQDIRIKAGLLCHADEILNRSII